MRATIDFTPCRSELLGVLVDRLDLVVELQALDALGGDDVRGALQRHADEADLDALVLPDRVRLEDRLAGLLVRDVGGEVGEVGALELLALLVAAVARGGSRRSAGASARRAPSSNSWLPTEVTSRSSLLSASMVGSSWKSPDSSGLAPTMSPAGGGDGVRVALAGRAQRRGEVLDAARRDRLRACRPAWSLGDGAGGAVRRLQVAVQVVEGQQLDVDGAAGVWRRGLVSAPAGSGGGAATVRGRGQYRRRRSSIGVTVAVPLRSRWHVFPSGWSWSGRRSLWSTRVAQTGGTRCTTWLPGQWAGSAPVRTPPGPRQGRTLRARMTDAAQEMGRVGRRIQVVDEVAPDDGRRPSST